MISCSVTKFVQNRSCLIAGVDNVTSTHNNKKLTVTGSADNNTIHYALKHIQKRHRHLLPQKLRNPFRLLFPRHSTADTRRPGVTPRMQVLTTTTLAIHTTTKMTTSGGMVQNMVMAMITHRNTTTRQVFSGKSCLIPTGLLILLTHTRLLQVEMHTLYKSMHSCTCTETHSTVEQ
jgi:hypothetical protein